MKKLLNGKSRWILILIIIAGSILRFAYLDRVPTGISDDELDTVLTARSVSYTGKTLEGIFSPFSLQSVPSDALVPYARAPYMLLAPVSGLLQHGLGEAKIPFVIISMLSTLVLVCISWVLWGKRIAIYTAFVSSFNPWSIYFGRTAFDTPISVFFINFCTFGVYSMAYRPLLVSGNDYCVSAGSRCCGYWYLEASRACI
jgi:4-amino-4-deoxy-L-arabinose transferase-like glycosyltransferase